jgi:hypothetical protein
MEDEFTTFEMIWGSIGILLLVLAGAIAYTVMVF